MTTGAPNEESIDSPSWIKRISDLWNTKNIKIVRRVIVSVVGTTVLLHCAFGFAGAGVHRYPRRTGYSCQGICLGATLAEKSSSNRNRRRFGSGSRTAPGYSSLALRAKDKG